MFILNVAQTTDNLTEEDAEDVAKLIAAAPYMARVISYVRKGLDAYQKDKNVDLSPFLRLLENAEYGSKGDGRFQNHWEDMYTKACDKQLREAYIRNINRP